MPKEALTIKQRRFVIEYIQTGNGTEAAVSAYDCQSRNTARSMASENLLKPAIQKAISEEMSTICQETFIKAKLHQLAESAKSEDTQLRALTIIAHITGLYNRDDKNGLAPLVIQLPEIKNM
ncbi:hypothetical protein A3E97_01575 [Candidatus Uhrbacteria bacterium RIFCSPHIGHO2_12_FULL_47_12]|uniref:Terminase n=1 Tax=Candidatus Uhrbacteria bacterium RIFCSPLOWO2_02_FULL_48_18 TaxID=1802408 RepID=A0A1F7VE26_9BACT|nr:MAG: hypothetical protein A2794_03840 [Alphaproteobacteria bacterium RIFCSPHIGHO2_01_FULL_40_8]OGL77068.1 MAG: hypothetical protein A3E97_01575 [Candidatus Uhrbacteria bacterium RIFCSPHIGHO2_12_FULL_47_12]OGL80583.1 MAG: hypothetical protein A3B20_04255 [Candidatus Uhrbacteria bacterium RIFCSPLOWO2_01_FULL_47_17]OGL88234.1 MAG: hypothetical protein A3I41_00725 [Candidatus Uhrbacteria bacterium RIFCSPLOWO2_02_FULL_48_18]OGL94249.1 MAG: hypothetical protein A3H12_02590 [Candidatus Uhrbacteria 